jgi:hypothetical protein
MKVLLIIKKKKKKQKQTKNNNNKTDKQNTFNEVSDIFKYVKCTVMLNSKLEMFIYIYSHWVISNVYLDIREL